MNRIIAILASLIMAFGLVGIHTLPASAATCGPTQIHTVNLYTNVDDDETRSYVRWYSQIYYANCGGAMQTRAVRYGFVPWTKYNSTLSCAAAVFRSAKLNPTSIAGHDYGMSQIPCKPGGNNVYRDFANVYSADRCFTVPFSVDKALLHDPTGTIPNNCRPN